MGCCESGNGEPMSNDADVPSRGGLPPDGLGLSVRICSCLHCDYSMDRDLSAAISGTEQGTAFAR
jgi:hypothetical protein